MRVAWFTPHRHGDPHLIDDTASLLAELGSRHEIELYDERRAPDLVWQQWRQPFDVCVYELSDTIESAFVWPYLLHYPGVVRLRSTRLGGSRRQALQRSRRAADHAAPLDHARGALSEAERAEVAFGGRAALRIPLTASRLTVVGDARAAQLLQEDYTAARVRHAPLAVTAAPLRRVEPRAMATVGIVGTEGVAMIERAAARARDAGALLDPRLDVNGPQASECDIVVAVEWPPRPEPPLGALRAMARGRPSIVYEAGVTAAWPALDPQTWQPRGFQAGEPIVVSLDPRDDEQSMMHALRRLSGDAGLRERMGAAAYTWAKTHATMDQAAATWERLLEEAAGLDIPALPADWPRHLSADGTERAREILAEIGVSVDFIR